MQNDFNPWKDLDWDTDNARHEEDEHMGYKDLFKIGRSINVSYNEYLENFAPCYFGYFNNGFPNTQIIPHEPLFRYWDEEEKEATEATKPILNFMDNLSEPRTMTGNPQGLKVQT